MSTLPYGVSSNNRQEIFHADKKEQDKDGRVRVDASYVRAQKDFAKMNTSVDGWKVAEEEQSVRKGLSPFAKWFCPRVNTITPLITASKSVYEMESSLNDLGEKLLKCDANNKAIPKTWIENSVQPFKLSRYEVVQALDYKLTPSAQANWKGWAVSQWWNNKDEAVVSTGMRSALVEEGARWNANEDRVCPASSSNVEKARQETIRNKAVWNVYTKMALNMTITAGVVCIPIMIACGSRQVGASSRR